jgi:hypothetical protein
VSHQLTTPRLTGLRDEARHVRLDGLRGDEQPSGDLGVGETARDQQVHVHLPAGNAHPAHLRRHVRVTAARPCHPLASLAELAATRGGELVVAGQLEPGGSVAQPGNWLWAQGAVARSNGR